MMDAQPVVVCIYRIYTCTVWLAWRPQPAGLAGSYAYGVRKQRRAVRQKMQRRGPGRAGGPRGLEEKGVWPRRALQQPEPWDPDPDTICTHGSLYLSSICSS
jgi:hypothetical protein